MVKTHMNMHTARTAHTNRIGLWWKTLSYFAFRFVECVCVRAWSGGLALWTLNEMAKTNHEIAITVIFMSIELHPLGRWKIDEQAFSEEKTGKIGSKPTILTHIHSWLRRRKTKNENLHSNSPVAKTCLFPSFVFFCIQNTFACAPGNSQQQSP